MPPILELDALRVCFATDSGTTPVVRGVDIAIGKGEITALVGESGCGKSVTCMAAMGLLDDNAHLSGAIRWQGRTIDPTNDKAMSAIRGNEMAMIFQDPMSALNPVQTIERQLIESIRINNQHSMSRKTARDRAVELLSDVGVPDPVKRLKAYPHQLSGGLSQRVMIAMMLAGNPSLLIADEPTTALDVTVQAQIMELLKALRDERGMSIVLVTHDLSVVAETCDTILVMYCGKVIERGPVKDIFTAPRHPYTAGLMRSLPRLDRKTEELSPVPGVVPQPSELGDGCDFAPRCARASDVCQQGAPSLCNHASGHHFACHHSEPIHAGANS